MYVGPAGFLMVQYILGKFVVLVHSSTLVGWLGLRIWTKKSRVSVRLINSLSDKSIWGLIFGRM